MSYNLSLKQDSLKKITKKLFKEALFAAYKDGITSLAPLGFSGDTVLMHRTDNIANNRCSDVSFRNYSGDCEMLITDLNGSFLFHGRLRVDIGVNFVVDHYWNIFKSVRHLIEKEVPRISEFKDIEIPKNCPRTIGFELLEMAQRKYPSL